MPKLNQLSEFEYSLTRVQDLHWEETTKAVDNKFKKFLNKGDTSEADFRNATTVGFGQHLLLPEGGKLQYDTFKKGRERVTTWKNFALGYRATKNLVRDMEKSTRVRKDTMKIFKGLQKRLRKSAEWTEEVIGANMLLKADVAQRDDLWPGAGGDGLALAAVNHSTRKGILVQFTNRQTSVTFSSVALMEMSTMLHNMPDDVGMPSGPPATFILLLPTIWEWRIEEVMGTTGQLDTFSNNIDALNKIKKKITVVVNEHLGPTFAGWMFADKEEHMLEYYEAQEPEFDSDRDFQTKGLLFSSDFRFSIDHQSPRWVAFNMG